MIKRVVNYASGSIAAGAGILAVAALGSRALGFLRNALLASTFGASGVLDAYFLAFRLPDLIFNVLFFGALSAGFVPVFIKLKKTDEGEAWALANDIFNLALLVFAVFGVVFFLAAPFVVSRLAPGFDAETAALAVTMSRIMFLQPIFLGVSGIFSGVLQSVRKFVSYSLAPIFYNVGIITGIVLVVPAVGPVGLAWGVVLGAALHLAVQYPAARSSGWRWRPVLAPGMRALRRVLAVMVPRSLSLIVHQVNLIVLVSLATVLGTGAVTVLNFANDIYGGALGLFVVPIGIAAFPAFVSASERSVAVFGNLILRTLRQLMFILVPLTALALVLRAQVVRLALGYGAFGWEETVLTIDTLTFLVLGLVFHGALLVILRAYFALEDARTPLFVMLGGMAVTIAASLALRGSLGVSGLALAMALGNSASALALFALLAGRVRLPRMGLLAQDLLVFALGSLIAAAAARGVLFAMAGAIVPTAKVWGLFVQASLATLAGAAAYIVAMKLAGVPEVERAWDRVKTFRLPRGVSFKETPDEELPR